MAHSSVKTLKDLIYWEYAKLIAGSSVGDRKNYAFVVHGYTKLRNGQIHPSAILRENKQLFESGEQCVYCGSLENLEWDHVIPRSKIDLDIMDNMVRACKSCNCSKGDKDLYEWYGANRKYEIPRIALGKYLKLVFDIHEKSGRLEEVSDIKLEIFDLGKFKK